MNDKTSNDLYGKIKHCDEFINHSNDSNLYCIVAIFNEKVNEAKTYKK